ncbi:hypothetical protein INR49_014728 [Caranx melampygus]|nr:hypothetical protein INR49_014728 [Caranx melampygus]
MTPLPNPVDSHPDWIFQDKWDDSFLNSYTNSESHCGNLGEVITKETSIGHNGVLGQGFHSGPGNETRTWFIERNVTIRTDTYSKARRGKAGVARLAMVLRKPDMVAYYDEEMSSRLKEMRWRVISLTSNIVVLLMFMKFKELRNATNFIIINLAFTDIGVAGIGYPMSAASDIHGSWKFGYTGCQKMTVQSYNLLILAAWLNAVFWSSMPIVGWAGYAPDPTGATCTINWRQNDASFISYTMAVIAVNFVLPLSTMFYCYYNVSVTVRRYRAGNCLDSINIDWSDQMDVTKMSIVMIIMFLVAWSPYSLVCLWASFGDPRTIPAPMAIIAPLFAKSSTFYNPCIYVIANKNYFNNKLTIKILSLSLSLYRMCNATLASSQPAISSLFLLIHAMLFRTVSRACCRGISPAPASGVRPKKFSIYKPGREKYVTRDL